MKLLHRGAEAVLFLKGKEVVKKRVKKGYRLPQLDERLRKQRTSVEARLMARARRAGVAVPRILDSTATDITMEFVKGERLKDSLEGLGREQRGQLYKSMGSAVAALHQAGIMHGDLTTSNMIACGGRLHLIDFGLSRSSSRVEDQAVDLFLLHEALQAGHVALAEEAWGGFLKAYKRNYSNAKPVLDQLEKIKSRRRYKSPAE